MDFSTRERRRPAGMPYPQPKPRLPDNAACWMPALLGGNSIMPLPKDKSLICSHDPTQLALYPAFHDRPA